MPSLVQPLDAGKSWPGLETEDARKLQQPRSSQGKSHISLFQRCVLAIPLWPWHRHGLLALLSMHPVVAETRSSEAAQWATTAAQLCPSLCTAGRGSLNEDVVASDLLLHCPVPLQLPLLQTALQARAFLLE